MNNQIIGFCVTVVFSMICFSMAAVTGETGYLIGGVVYNAATFVILSMDDK